MKPLTMILLAALAALAGFVLALFSERLVRRSRPELAHDAEVGLARLRWLSAGVAVTLAVKASISGQPALALAWLPLALVGPWVVAVHVVGAGSSDRVLAITTFLTLNGVVLATAFTGRAELLPSAAAGFLLTGCLAVLVRRFSGGALSVWEVRIAALVGLACGSLGLPAVGIALGWAVLSAGTVWTFGRFRLHAVGTALLGGAWLAGIVAL